MNPIVKDKWLKALTSNKYKKGKKTLRCIARIPVLDAKGKPVKDENGREVVKIEYSFCCLGVLSDLYREEFGGVWHGVGFLNSNAYLSGSVVKWAGLEQSELKEYSQFHDIVVGDISLADLNDKTSTYDKVIEVIKDKL